jgi:D-aspartate ligase
MMVAHGTGRRRPTAVVLGGTELVRPLALAGIRCVAVAPTHDATRFSRHVTTVIHWDWTGAAGRDDELLARLLQYGRSQPEPPALFYQSDEDLLFVSRRRQQLSRSFRFVIAEATMVETLVDKARFQGLARALSLPVPATTVVESGSAQPPDEPFDLGFPLIVKPLQRADGVWMSVEPTRKALRVDSPEQLRALWPRLSVLGRQLIMQRYVDGPENRIESYHVYVDRAGEIAAQFTGRKIRTRPLECGQTTSLTLTDAEDVARLGRRLVRTLSLEGVAKFDFKRGPDGALHLLEVNPRFNLWHHPGARAGVNIPALVHADLTGRRRPEPARRHSNVSWCSPRDFIMARESGVPFIRWLPWALSCEAKAVWAWDDPLPMIATGSARVAGLLRDRVRRPSTGR